MTTFSIIYVVNIILMTIYYYYLLKNKIICKYYNELSMYYEKKNSTLREKNKENTILFIYIYYNVITYLHVYILQMSHGVST